MAVSTVQFNLPVFNGPLDLLLHLIRKQKIDIYDIPIQTVTVQYMDYLARAEAFNLQLGTEFFQMAATLLAIKARSLLPKAPAEEEEEDPRQELAERLIAWEHIQTVKSEIETRLAENAFFLEKEPTPLQASEYTLRVSMERLAGVWQRLIQKEEPAEADWQPIPELDPKPLREAFLKAIQHGSVELIPYFEKLTNRWEQLTLFLEVLEMIWQGTITVKELGTGIYVERLRHGNGTTRST